MRNNKGFTLIELMIVIAIIAVIAAIAIPGILTARRSANENAAFGSLKSFITAAANYANDDPNGRFPAGAATGPFNTNTTATNTSFVTALGDYYSHVASKGGYFYKYATNTDFGQYVYYAYPTTVTNGERAFYVDEANRAFEAAVGTAALVSAINGYDPAGVDFSSTDNRVDVGATVVWTRR